MLVTRKHFLSAIPGFACMAFGRDSTVHRSTHFVSGQTKILVDEFSPATGPRTRLPAILILSGSGGLKPQSPRYRGQAIELAERGYGVYLPHYIDATRGSVSNPEAKYTIWVRAVHDSITSTLAATRNGPVALIGYSLGASVALAEASQDTRVKGVISWSGSMPDEYARSATALPPLLIIHGEKDDVIPIADAVQLTKLCDLLKARCEFQPFKGESHVFSDTAVRTANELIWKFLESLS
jgi:dienelactone hydrolase